MVVFFLRTGARRLAPVARLVGVRRLGVASTPSVFVLVTIAVATHFFFLRPTTPP